MAELLIIDDDLEIHKSMRAALESVGHRVRAAANGDLGIRMYCERPAALIFCDIFMPEKEGLSTIRELKRRFPDARIVAISGGSSAWVDWLDLARTFGAMRVLYKPFGIKELYDVVNVTLGS